MKTLIENINSEKAQEIKMNNNEYLVWVDGSEISVEEIESNFKVTEYESGSINLEHKQDDFRIEDIIF